MTTNQCVRNTEDTDQAVMPIHTQMLQDLVARIISVDTSDGSLDLDTVERIRQRRFDDEILAVARSGLFTARDIDTLVQCWRAHPRSLFDALLANSDDLTRRRYRAIWNSPSALDTREYA